MILMHGMFDLKDDSKEDEFRQSFSAFSEHLQKAGMALSSRLMRHQAHDGYNAPPPATKYYVAIEFADLDQAERCWKYIEQENEPVASKHTAVFSRISNSKFFLTSDVWCSAR